MNLIGGISLGANGTEFDLVAGDPFAASVATFTDSAPASTPADFSATISWGDGHISHGTISYDPTTQQYTVSGSNVYSTATVRCSRIDPGRQGKWHRRDQHRQCCPGDDHRGRNAVDGDRRRPLRGARRHVCRTPTQSGRRRLHRDDRLGRWPSHQSGRSRSTPATRNTP